MNVTILVDNKVERPELIAEHGFALWIEADGRRILFDTGQGGALEGNARRLGVDLAATHAVVLSHGHYDHSGGLARVLRLAPGAHVYAHPALVLPRYSVRAHVPRSIAVPAPSLAALQRLAADRLHWLQQPTRLADNIGLSGPIHRDTDYEDNGGPFYTDRQGKRPDPIADDLALWLRVAEGLVVCVGCAHAGVVNTLELVHRLNPGEPLHAVIDGFHLGSASPERLEQTIAALRRLAVERVVPCHCTGEAAMAALRVALGERVSSGAAGLAFDF